MNNTDKLLRAFIEASGYEIKRVRTGDEKCDCYKSNPLSRDHLIGCQRCQGTGVSHGIFDYKVTKTKLQQGLDDNRLSIPNSRRLTKECIEDLLSPNKPIGGVIVLRYEDE